ncbi:hypothetical protein C2G38_150280 [Gigaspora rosea]|uniref:Uncharacterized protein n=1 Tax=Gigaspora rosea TaxID=44941 RepID=A0A397W6Z7_9GLOM|nr:hypothetical protein C2G38_150280 [Gigaspora rosea]
MLFSIPHRLISLYHTGFMAYTTQISRPIPHRFDGLHQTGLLSYTTQVLRPIPHRFDGLTSTLTTPDLCRSSGET